MIIIAQQTPTAEPTPAAIYRSMPLTLPDEETSQIEELLDGLSQNSIGRYDKTHPLDEIRARIGALCSLAEGWNGYDVAAPNPASIEKSHWWIRSMYRDARRDVHCAWMDPHVSANEDGDVTLSGGTRKRS